MHINCSEHRRCALNIHPSFSPSLASTYYHLESSVPSWFRGFKVKQNGDFSGGPVVKTSPSNAGGAGSTPGRGAKIPHAFQPKNQNIKQKQYCNKFNKDFKNGPHQKEYVLKK